MQSDLLPSYKPDEQPDEGGRHTCIFDIMEDLQMPILDTSVIPQNPLLNLPSLSDHDKMLSNLNISLKMPSQAMRNGWAK